MERKFRMDKTAFKATTAEEADDHVSEWKNKTYKERLEAAYFLISHVYGVDLKTRMDRTVFSKRTR